MKGLPQISTAVLFLTLVLQPFGAGAQVRPLSCAREAKLSQAEGARMMAELQKRYSELSGFQADFKQSSFLAALETSEDSSGTVAYRKPGRMKWVYRAPEEQVFLLANGTFWYYQGRDRQLLVDCLRDSMASDVPVAFLLGLGDLSRDFSFEDGCRRSGGLVLDLKPKSRAPAAGEGALTDLRLLLDENSLLPKGADVLDLAGNRTSLLLVNTKWGVSVSEEEFAPRFPAGTDIDDRRPGVCKQ